MLEKYPEILFVKKTPDAFLDLNGDFNTKAEEIWQEYSMCKSVVNGSAQLIELGDSSKYVFSAVIYIPERTDELELGDEIKVLDLNGKLLRQGRVKNFLSGKYGSKLWI